MNFYLQIKPIKTESSKDNSKSKLLSTASSKRTASSLRWLQQQDKKSSSDYRAFKMKYKIHLIQHFTCFSLIKLPYPSSFVTNAELLKLEFSPLSYTFKDLILYAKFMIQSNEQRKAIGKSFNLLKLLQTIADNYNVLAYHNFTHAFSVFLMLYQSYSRCQRLQIMLSQRQWFYIFIAALIHDINHPGTNNAFQVKRKSQLALQANNEAVLQQMHLKTFWSLLKSNSQINFLQGYSHNQANEIKKLITRMVMSTDASKHSEGISTLKELYKHRKSLQGQNAMLLIEQFFHGCDIGNPCLPFDSYISWSVLITYEMDTVAAQEQQLGLEVSPFLKYEGLDKFYRCQLNFCNSFVLPLWKQIGHILPSLDEMLHNIVQNIEKLRARIASLSI